MRTKPKRDERVEVPSLNKAMADAWLAASKSRRVYSQPPEDCYSIKELAEDIFNCDPSHAARKVAQMLKSGDVEFVGRFRIKTGQIFYPVPHYRLTTKK